MNAHRQRIAVLSKILRFLSLVAFVYLSICSIISIFIPVVSVPRTYTPPPNMASSIPGRAANDITTSTEFDSPGNQLILQLAGDSPSIEFFSYLPGPSSIRDDRRWLAHSVAFIVLSYSVLGAWLFYRLFHQFSQGRVFELKSIRYLKHIGIWYMGALPMTLFFTFSKPYWSLGAPMQITLSGGLFTGIFLFVIAWTLEEAFLMEKDLQLTI